MNDEQRSVAEPEMRDKKSSESAQLKKLLRR